MLPKIWTSPLKDASPFTESFWLRERSLFTTNLPVPWGSIVILLLLEVVVMLTPSAESILIPPADAINEIAPVPLREEARFK